MWNTSTSLAEMYSYTEPCKVHSLLPAACSSSPSEGAAAPLSDGKLGGRPWFPPPWTQAPSQWRCLVVMPGHCSLSRMGFPSNSMPSKPACTHKRGSQHSGSSVPVRRDTEAPSEQGQLSHHQFECVPEQISWHPVPTLLSSTALQPGDKTRSLGSQGGEGAEELDLGFPFFSFFFSFKNLKVAVLAKGNYPSVPAEIQLRRLSTSPRDIVVY